jgi:hypothetical protein
MNFISLPTKISQVVAEIDFHGDAITQEINSMHAVIDHHGKNIENEIEMLRNVLEKESKALQKRTRNMCIVLMAVNVVWKIVSR